MTEEPLAPRDPRFDSFATASFIGRLIILQRAALAYLALIGFLLVPTVRLKATYALVISRIPLFRRFLFFRIMYSLIDEAKREGARS